MSNTAKVSVSRPHVALVDSIHLAAILGDLDKRIATAALAPNTRHL